MVGGSPHQFERMSVNEDAGLRSGVDCEIRHRLEERVSANENSRPQME